MLMVMVTLMVIVLRAVRDPLFIRIKIVMGVGST